MPANRHFRLTTERPIQAIDVTDLVTAEPLPDGMAWIACPHTTAALLIGEGDPEMLADYERVAASLFAPFEPFRHRRNDNPNAAAHLFSSLAGSQIVLPVEDGKLVLGSFQRLIFLELDGPRTGRSIELRTMRLPGVEEASEA